MKKHLFLSISLFLILCSCSSDDDSPVFDVELLYDQWYFNYGCPDQNNLVLNKDGNYAITQSGNPCDDHRQNTTGYACSYLLNGVL